MTSISRDAQILSHAFFGILAGETTTITLDERRRRIHPRTRSALDELLAANLITVERRHTAYIYRPTTEILSFTKGHRPKWKRPTKEDGSGWPIMADMKFPVTGITGHQAPTPTKMARK